MNKKNVVTSIIGGIAGLTTIRAIGRGFTMVGRKGGIVGMVGRISVEAAAGAFAAGVVAIYAEKVWDITEDVCKKLEEDRARSMHHYGDVDEEDEDEDEGVFFEDDDDYQDEKQEEDDDGGETERS